MSEVSFAKTFLGVLDSRPQKFSPDHIQDPHEYPPRTPYILPRMPRPMTKRARTAAPGEERSVTVLLKSLRNPPLDVKLTAQPLTTSLLDVKAALAAETGLAADKLRLLHGKKPVADSKVLKDVVGDGDTTVEFSVMVMGGAAAAAVKSEPAGAKAGGSSTAQGPSGRDVVEGEAFWNDLRGFLLQRVRDEKQVDELFSMFLRAWEENS